MIKIKKDHLWWYLLWVVLLVIICGMPGRAEDIVIKKDTTVNNTWIIPAGTILRFESGGIIRGHGCIQGGIYQGAYSQQLFDTSMQLKAFTVYGDRFSAAWYGAGKYQDNWWPIQKSLNACIENGADCFLPRGTYNISASLKMFYIYKGAYSGIPTRFFGESNVWREYTIINYLPATGFALGVQVGKGAEIDHITVRGQFRAPITTGVDYYTTPMESFGPDGSYGIVIDYDNSLNSSGSTAVKVHDTKVSGFTVLYSVSPNGSTVNADFLKFEDIQCGEGRIGYQTGQAQEKGNTVRNIISWGRLHTLISIGRAGKRQAGNYNFDGGNIAGGCIQLFDINQSGWYTSTISNFFGESLWSLGSATTGDSRNTPPLPIYNSTFHFAILAGFNNRPLLSSNSTAIKFTDCMFRFYGASDSMNFAGLAMYSDCFFSGTVKNLTAGSVFVNRGVVK